MASSPRKRSSDGLNDAWRDLVSGGELRAFPAGAVIFAAGDPGDGFYVVESGAVRIEAVVGQNESRGLATIGVGDFFGEMAVLDDAPRSATATAEVDTTVRFVERDRLLQLLDRQPQLALTLIREFSLRMRALNQKYVDEIIHAERLAAVGRFAGTIVHDFKNPLTVIGLAAEMACQDNLPLAVRQKTQGRIARQIDRMNNMLYELIDFTKPTGQRPALRPTDFAAFITPLIAEIAQEVTTRKAELLLVGEPPHVEVPMNAQRLSRLFYNLINNAVDEMPDGGKIFVRTAVKGNELTVAIQDTGRGIAPAIAKNLFQPFATHGKSHGTGLGLSICKRIVEDHDGRIWAESKLGEGATFSFTLPVQR
jgi:signal transduction histidine kinase